jgi:hypothetical protein
MPMAGTLMESAVVEKGSVHRFRIVGHALAKTLFA